MKNYEIIVRIQDPNFDKIIKKAFSYTKEEAQDIWQMKQEKQSITLNDNGIEYMLSHGDILQIRQKSDGGHSGKVDSKGYKQTLIGSHKILLDEDDEHGRYKNYYVFEICRTKKLKEGWMDSQYEEVLRITEDEYRHAPDDVIAKTFSDLEKKHLK